MTVCGLLGFGDIEVTWPRNNARSRGFFTRVLDLVEADGLHPLELVRVGGEGLALGHSRCEAGKRVHTLEVGRETKYQENDARVKAMVKTLSQERAGGLERQGIASGGEEVGEDGREWGRRRGAESHGPRPSSSGAAGRTRHMLQGLLEAGHRAGMPAKQREGGAEEREGAWGGSEGYQRGVRCSVLLRKEGFGGDGAIGG